MSYPSLGTTTKQGSRPLKLAGKARFLAERRGADAHHLGQHEHQPAFAFSQGRSHRFLRAVGGHLLSVPTARDSEPCARSERREERGRFPRPKLRRARKWALFLAALLLLAGCGSDEPTAAENAEQRVRAEVRGVEDAHLTALTCRRGRCSGRVRYGEPVTEQQKDENSECWQTAEDPMLDCDHPNEPMFQRVEVRYDKAGRLHGWAGAFE